MDWIIAYWDYIHLWIGIISLAAICYFLFWPKKN